MTIDVDALEGVAGQLQDAQPEYVKGPDAGLSYPYLKTKRMANFVRFFHPDGTVSDLAAPTFNPQRPTPYLERFLTHYLRKRGPDGKPWFFLRKQAEPAPAPFQCFIQTGAGRCQKHLQTLPALYMHVMTRHTEEAKMYASTLEALNQKMQAHLDPELVKALGLGTQEEAAAVIPQVEENDLVVGKPELFYCGADECGRFFDSAKARDMHESGPMSPHKAKAKKE
jgi:hypothetical protein